MCEPGGRGEREAPASTPALYEVWLPGETLGHCVLRIHYWEAQLSTVAPRTTVSQINLGQRTRAETRRAPASRDFWA